MELNSIRFGSISKKREAKTFFVMRAIGLLTILFSLTAFSQSTDTHISLLVTNAPLEQVLKEIKKQSGYEFVYTREQLKKSVPVTVQLQSAGITEALEACFKGQPFTYVMDGKFIALRDLNETIIPVKDQGHPSIDISGRVVGPNGEAVPGATIRIQSSGIASGCDEQGKFRLQGVDPGCILVVSSIGYQTREVPLAGQSFIVIQMFLSVSQLDQTVIIGYGKTTRRFSTGSVTKLTAEDIGEQPVSNPLAALEGRVPGLTVTATSGLPGASFNVQIRGQNSLKAQPGYSTIPPMDQPLFIVDGVPLATQNSNINQLNSIASPGLNFSLNNFYGGISPFSSINPSEIESIEVLRDADATAIYGSRGANGVILITTKRGSAGKTSVNATIYSGFSSVIHTMPMMETKQYLEMRREAIQNDGNMPNLALYDPGYAPDLLLYDTSKYTNWKHYFTGKKAPVSDANVSISGGTAGTQFRLAAGYHREGYVFPGDFDYNRSSFGTSVHHTSENHKLVIDFSSDYSTDHNNSSPSTNLLSAYTLEPDYPDLTDLGGNLNWSYNGVTLGGSYGVANMNPLAYLQKKYSIANTFLTSHLQLEYKVLPGLLLRPSLGYNLLYTDEYSGDPAASQNPDFSRTASADFAHSNYKGWIIEPQAEYRKLFGDNSLTVLMGSTFQKDENSASHVSAWGYSNDALIKGISGAPNKSVTDAYSRYKYNAVFGRISYLKGQRYIVNLNARRDGSSRFGPGQQFGNFGSIGLGWIFSEEKFFKKLFGKTGYGKLRTSYGTTGNDNSIANYQYIARWAPTNYGYQGSQGYLSQNLYNPVFSWAVTKKLEAALELGLLKNRLFLGVTWYRDRSGNQLVYYQLPSQTGFQGVTENWPALVENRGFEFTFTSTNIKTKAVTWSTSFNLTIPKNRLVSFPGIESSSYATSYIVGKPLSELKKFRYGGVNDSTGLFQFYASDGKVTSFPRNVSAHSLNDLKAIGDLDPKLFGGLSNTVSVKGFYLDVFFEFKKQTGTNYLGQIYSYGVPGFQYNQPAALLSRWQKPGDHSDVQKFSATYSDAYSTAQYFSQSSGVYSDASYLRCKTLCFGYELPAKALERMKMNSCRLYIQAQNVFTISKYLGDDPETQNFFGIPTLRTVTGGIQMNF